MNKKLCLLSTILLVAFAALHSTCVCSASPDVIWLEAESFDSTGGWVNDSQFVDVMGSPYLLANGVDEPVEDAVTAATVSEKGTYRLWVRCKDWLPPHSPGTFQVSINGEASKTTFGVSDDNRWRWVDGGEFDLQPGKVEVRLHDLSGWWGRCDAIVLSSDERFQPAGDVLLLEKQRIRYFDPYRGAKTLEPYDVVVVGGGLAGSAAAVEAARQGLRTALIQDRPVLGGNASSEIDVPPGGDNTNIPLDPKETGVIEDFYPKPGRGFDYDWSTGIEKVVRAEPNLDLHLNSRAINIVMKDESAIEAILALDSTTNQRLLFPGKIFIDCTGDGWIGFWAGATFRKGREARSEFNESLAPETSDLRTMGNTLFVAQFREGDSTPFVCPEWAITRWKSEGDFEDAGTHFGLEQTQIPVDGEGDGLANRFTQGAGLYGRQYQTATAKIETEQSSFRSMPIQPDHYKRMERGNGYKPRNEDGGFFQWYIELGGMQDTIYDAEEIRDELFRINLGLWNYVKNHHPEYKKKNENRRLTWINYAPGKRESRRLEGDYILTQWDYADRIIHDDNVAYGGWGVDVHHPNGFWKSGPMYYSAYRGQQVSIPFRTLYSKNVSNLMMAGRDVSVSHVALGGVRVMRTTCLMGQACGAAAAVCVENNETPREANRRSIRDIQQRLMKSGAYIMGQKNEDPADLALNADASASSVKSIPDLKSQFAVTGTPLVHDLNMQRAVTFQAGRKKIDGVWLYLRSKNGGETPVEAVLRQAPSFGDFSSRDDLAEAVARVSPNSKGWVKFEFSANVDPEKYYYVALAPKSGIQWDLFPMKKENACRAYGGPNWTRREECYAFSLDGAAEFESVPDVALNPKNAIDGYSRVVDSNPHSWGPDPKQDGPQWLELRWDDAQTFNAVHVSFQNYDYLCPAYQIQIKDGNAWKTVVEIEGNERRRNVHRFSAVRSNAVRLVLNASALNHPQDSAQVCEIRVYHEAQ